MLFSPESLRTAGDHDTSQIQKEALIVTTSGEMSNQSQSRANSANNDGIVLGEQSGNAPLAEAWFLVQKYKLLILGCVLSGIALAVVARFTLRQKYDAEATIQLNFDNSDSLQLDESSAAAALLNGGDSEKKLATEVEVLKSHSLALKTIGAQHLVTNSAFSKPSTREGVPSLQNPLTVERLLNAFSSSVKVSTVAKTNAIRIRTSTYSPELSALIANTLVNEYIERGYQDKFKDRRDLADWLAGQLGDLQDQTQKAQERMLALQKKLGVLDIVAPSAEDQGSKGFAGAPQTLLTQRLEGLQQALTAAEGDRLVKEARFKVLEGEKPGVIEDVAPQSVLEALRGRRADLDARLQSEKQKYGPNFPRVRILQKQLDDLDASIGNQESTSLERVRAEFVAAQQTERATRAALDVEKSRADELNDTVIQFTIAQREFESSYRLYEELLRHLKEAGILAGLHANNVSVIDPAMIPLHQSFPRLSILGLMGIFAGVLVSGSAILILESLKIGVDSVDELQRIVGIPSLGFIPQIRAGDADVKGASSVAPHIASTAMLSRPKSDLAEAYRTLRTSILLSHADHPPQVLVVSSSIPKEGKTTTAINTAIALSIQKGTRVLLIDSDLRRASIHSRLRVPNTRGLSNILTGTATLEQCVSKIDEAVNLDILTSGPPPPLPSELLGGRALPALLEYARQTYDFIVIDTPPVISVSDPLLVTRYSDGVLLVVRFKTTPRQLVQQTCSALLRSEAKILGGVLNAVDMSAPQYGGYRYDSYSYYADDAN